VSDPGHGAGLSWLVRPRSPLDPSPLSMAASYAILGFWTFVVLFPLYWVFITSFKQPIDVNDGPFYLMWVDFQPSLHAWKYIFVDLGHELLLSHSKELDQSPLGQLRVVEQVDNVGERKPDGP
jgi:multiple sugar transport system permease protein